MSTLTLFKQLVHQRCGLHLEGLAEARLVKAVALLRTRTGIHSPTLLISKLEQDSPLFDYFISQLTVNETYFFREPEALNWLANTHLPRLLAKKNAPLSILSAGCSSGEEPYSLAIALYERYGERAKQLFHITGGDVDQQVLDKAQAGIYGGMAFRALHSSLKLRYFSAAGRRFKLLDTLRQWVTFCSFNLLDRNAQALGGPFDVILFRNVSIYFDEATRRAIQQHLKQLLTPDGILLCGVTETLGNDLGVLEMVEEHGLFYFRDHAGPPHSPAPSGMPTVTSTPTAACHSGSVDGKSIHSRPAPTPGDAGSQVSVTPKDFHDTLHQANDLLNQSSFTEARSLLEPLLVEQPWSVDALLLAGLVARWQQQPQQAFDYFKRALYVAPECWPAHFYQAELLRLGELTGNAAQRHRGYAAVVRLLESSPQADGALQVISPPLPPGDACFLSKRYLSEQTAIQGVG
ncbi:MULTISPECIES: CheR family methyltransferase [unclassified Halomonas]|uniref:CheR family methyltransferase n=1 Tax=unclassified Halomonas TaxID=2609666 RepID=UPI0009905F18|nr:MULTISPECIES: protein-glutamate O-methyltransferase CheR [unclassified Halomonas]AQU83736.1 methylase [Halomonas sp. 'Soap Lake \